jgi:hypothetical protein
MVYWDGSIDDDDIGGIRFIIMKVTFGVTRIMSSLNMESLELLKLLLQLLTYGWLRT